MFKKENIIEKNNTTLPVRTMKKRLVQNVRFARSAGVRAGQQ